MAELAAEKKGRRFGAQAQTQEPQGLKGVRVVSSLRGQ